MTSAFAGMTFHRSVKGLACSGAPIKRSLFFATTGQGRIGSPPCPSSQTHTLGKKLPRGDFQLHGGRSIPAYGPCLSNVQPTNVRSHVGESQVRQTARPVRSLRLPAAG